MYAARMRIIVFVTVAFVAFAALGASAQSCSNPKDCKDVPTAGDYLLACRKSNCTNECTDNKECPAKYTCATYESSATLRCISRTLFPGFGWQNGVGTLATFVGAMLAAGGGLGGGGMFVPIFILIVGLSAHEAVPLSQCMIFGGAIVNLAFNWRKRHPDSDDRPLIDYDAVLMLEPLMLAGTVIGVYLNAVFPSWLLVVMLAIILSIAAYRTFKKGMRVYRADRVGVKPPSPSDIENVVEIGMTEVVIPNGVGKDAGDNEEHKEKDGDESGAPAAAVGGEEEEEKEKEKNNDEGASDVVTSKDEKEIAVDASAASPSSSALSEVEKEKHLNRIKESERGQIRQFAMVVGVLIGVALLSCFRGGRVGTTSFVGVVSCSAEYWVVVSAIFVYLFGFTAVFGRHLVKVNQLKEQVGYIFLEGDIHWTTHNVIKYPLLAIFAGTVGGLLGIGGGMIMGPLLLELGMKPGPVAATSATTVLLACSSSVIQHVLLQDIMYDYAGWYFMVGFLATIVGQTLVNYLVKKYNSTHFIVFTIVAVLGVSTIMMVVVGVRRVVSDVNDGANMGFKSFC